jgi:hypothetical protein
MKANANIKVAERRLGGIDQLSDPTEAAPEVSESVSIVLSTSYPYFQSITCGIVPRSFCYLALCTSVKIGRKSAGMMQSAVSFFEPSQAGN